MKKVLILSGISDNRLSTDYAGHFSKYIGSCKFTNIKFDHLVFEVTPNKFEVTDGRSGQNLRDYDLVMIREYRGIYIDMAYAVSKYLELAGIPFFNKNYLIYRPISKLAQAILFHLAKVNFPATYLSLNPELLKPAIQLIGYPAIVKDTMGMHGSINFLVKSFNELSDAFEQNPKTKFIVQPYHPNTHDYRILLMGDEEPLQIKRTRTNSSHLNNTSRGAIGEVVNELPGEILSQARGLTKAFQIDVGGIDVLQSQQDGQYYFLEVNNQPQLVTGAVTQAKIKKFEDFLNSYFTKTDRGA